MQGAKAGLNDHVMTKEKRIRTQHIFIVYYIQAPHTNSSGLTAPTDLKTIEIPSHPFNAAVWNFMGSNVNTVDLL